MAATFDKRKMCIYMYVYLHIYISMYIYIHIYIHVYMLHILMFIRTACHTTPWDCGSAWL